MSELIQRYLDGELSETEADALRAALARDPQLDAELRAWERLLGGVAHVEEDGPSAAFDDGVMRAVAARRRRLAPSPPWLFNLSRGARLAWAATLVVTFGAGLLAARVGDRPGQPAPLPAPGGPGGDGAQTTAAAYVPEQGDMRVVRLVYAPKDPSVRRVHVAGTFNEWDPQGVALTRQGSLWTVVLILPRGTYEYMFVEDDDRWVTDPLALQTRDDGFGRKNAVLDLSL